MSIPNDTPGWPNFENLGYEDLAFSTGFLNNTLNPASSANYPMSLFGDIYGTANLYGDPFNVGPTTVSSNGTGDSVEQQRYEAASQSQGASTSPTEKSGSSSLLKTYYRLSVPSQLPGFTEADLVGYYFHNVCVIFSCFDSTLNPFRTMVSELCSKNATIYLAIQSMAVAHVSNHYPYMAPVGLGKRSQAWKSLQHDLRLFRMGKANFESVFMSLLLLGLSSAWHQASNLGQQYLFTARHLMQSQLQSYKNNQKGEASKDDDFFENGLLYWEMVASFVEPVPLMPLPGLKAPDITLPTRSTPVQAHPWTGVSPEVHYALGEIGRILRRQRIQAPVMNLGPDEEQWAGVLERFLYSVNIPEPHDIVDLEDSMTTKTDLVQAAKAYQYVGLLEIYLAFPMLLRERLGNGSILEGLNFSQVDSEGNLDAWVMAFSNHILETIKPIEITSGASRLLPMILMVIGGQMRLPDTTDSIESTETDRIVDARYTIEARMLDLSRKYPQRPLLQMIDIIKEVWQRLDDGSPHAHWIDVAHEKRWQTIMG